MSLIMHTLHVELGERSYPVYIGRDLLTDQGLLDKHIGGSQIVIITNETVSPLYMDRLRAALGERKLVTEIVLPDGEQFKTLDTLSGIFDLVMTDRHNRSTTFRRDCPRNRLAVFAVTIVGNYFAAKLAGAVQLGRRRVLRHNDRRVNTEQLSCECNALRMIAG